MKVRLVRPYRRYSKGYVLEVPNAHGAEMIRMGYAVEDVQQELPETACVEVQSRKADLTLKRRNRRQ